MSGLLDEISRIEGQTKAAPAQKSGGILSDIDRIASAPAPKPKAQANAAQVDALKAPGVGDYFSWLTGGETRVDKATPKLNSMERLIAGVPQERTLWQQTKDVAGRTARIAGSGLANSYGIVADPIMAAYSNLTGRPFQKQGEYWGGKMDEAGLARPTDPVSRVADSIGEMAVGSAGLIKGGQQLATHGTGLAQQLGNFLATDPALQLKATLGAGAASGAVRELGGGTGAQIAAALTGGVLAPGSIDKLTRPLMSNAANEAKALVGQVIEQTGVSLAPAQRVALEKQAAEAMKNGKPPIDALKNSAIFRELGIDPLSGWVGRDPKQWAYEQSMRGVNDRISQAYNDANTKLVGALDAGPQSDYSHGKQIIGSIKDVYEGLKGKAGELYGSLRDNLNRDIPLNGAKVMNESTQQLEQNLLLGKLPNDVAKWLRSFKDGRPLGYGEALERHKAINGLIGGAADGAERKALGIVKDKLEAALGGEGLDSPVLAAGGSQKTADAMQALSKEQAAQYKAARQAAQDYFNFEKSSELARKAIAGKLTEENVPGLVAKMPVKDLNALVAQDGVHGSGQIIDSIQSALKAHIRDMSVGSSADGGKFSIAGFRRALDQIGPEKGRMIFGDYWNQLQNIGKAGGMIHDAPPGAVAPSSGTAQALARFAGGMPIPGVSPAVALMGKLLTSGNSELRAIQATKGAVAPTQRNSAALGNALAGSLRASVVKPVDKREE